MYSSIANIRRPVSHPSPVAETMHKRFQGLDDPQAMNAMGAEVRKLDLLDGRQAFGNGPNSPAIREAGMICCENLQSNDISADCKVAILEDCVPMFCGLLSGKFPDVLEALYEQVVQQKVSADINVQQAATQAERLLRNAVASRSRPLASLLIRAEQPAELTN